VPKQNTRTRMSIAVICADCGVCRTWMYRRLGSTSAGPRRLRTSAGIGLIWKSPSNGSPAAGHDWAVFHLLTKTKHREAYVCQVREVVKVGGQVMVASFGPEGPRGRSGPDVVRYDAETLHGEFGAPFQLVMHLTERHRTPFRTTQPFVYGHAKSAVSRERFQLAAAARNVLPHSAHGQMLRRWS